MFFDSLPGFQTADAVQIPAHFSQKDEIGKIADEDQIDHKLKTGETKKSAVTYFVLLAVLAFPAPARSDQAMADCEVQAEWGWSIFNL